MQIIIAIAIVAVCAALTLRRAARSLRGKKTGCGCAECPALAKSGRAAAPPTVAPGSDTARHA